MLIPRGHLLIIKRCQRCGKEFWQYVKSGDGRKYCSRKCRYAKQTTCANKHDSPLLLSALEARLEM